MRHTLLPILVFWCVVLSSLVRSSAAMAQEGDPPRTTNPSLRAGAAAVEIAPQTFPVLVNGGFFPARAAKVNDPIRAKCLVLDDGATRLAIVVVDSCMMRRALLDQAKALAR